MSSMATVDREATSISVDSAAPEVSWNTSRTRVVLALVLCSVSSLCHWLPLAPDPVPAAGMMRVAALAAIGSRAAAVDFHEGSF